MSHLTSVMAKVELMALTIVGVVVYLVMRCRIMNLIKLIILAGLLLTEKKGPNVQVLAFLTREDLRPRQTYRLTKKHS